MSKLAIILEDEPWILRPFDRREAISLREAAELTGRSVSTMLRWSEEFHLGRRIAGKWAMSRVAIAMFMDGDLMTLQRYLNGDRTSEQVTSYFARCVPNEPKSGKQKCLSSDIK